MSSSEGETPKKCPICGENGEFRCSSCKSVFYCSETCQKQDWSHVHRLQCGLIRRERRLLKDFHPRVSPLEFSVKKLLQFARRASLQWKVDPQLANLALSRMELFANEAADDSSDSTDWLRLCSVLFGACMVHNVINAYDNDDVWLKAYFYNFGELLDRVKLYAIFQAKKWTELLTDESFPLLDYFDNVDDRELKLTKDQKCMICDKAIVAKNSAISSHTPRNKSQSASRPRQVNFIPPSTVSSAELRKWVKNVVRLRTFTKSFVCSENCEQHALFGRLFVAHPLEKRIKH